MKCWVDVGAVLGRAHKPGPVVCRQWAQAVEVEIR